MASFDFTIGQGDDGIRWSVPVYDAEGNQFDPTGMTVALHFRIDDDSAAAVDLVGALVTQAVGPPWVGYTFKTADLAVPGVYLAQWVITETVMTVVTERLTYPSDRKMRVLVENEA